MKRQKTEATGSIKTRWSRRKLLFGLLFGILTFAVGIGFYTAYFSNAIKEARRESAFAERQQEWEKTAKWAQRWTELDPRSTDAWLRRANAAKNMFHWEELVTYLNHVPPDHANFLEANALAADTLIGELKDVQRAEETLLKLNAHRPDSAHSTQRLTFIYSMTQQRTKLSNLLRNAIDKKIEPREAYFYLFALTNLIFTDGLFKNMTWEVATPEFEPVVVSRALYLARTKSTEATNLFGDDQAIPGDLMIVTTLLAKQYPQNFELLCYSIEHAIVLGSVEKVRELMTHFLPEHYELARYWQYQGWIADNDEDFETAVEYYEKSLRLDPLNYSTHHEFGNVLRTVGDQHRAEQELELAGRGKRLERELVELPTFYEATETQNLALLDYINQCGAKEIATAFEKRLAALLPDKP